MRKLSFIFASLLLVVTMYAQDLKAIKLSSPDKNRGSSVMKALSDRHSDREYAAKELSLQDLSDLLWAANGINRPDGKRTAPSALNKQDIDIYVIMKEGAPNNASTLLLYYIYQQGFTNFNYGVSSALTTVMLLLLMVVALPRFLSQDKKIQYN